VTHSIPEAVRVGSRTLLLSPHPGQVRAELNRDGDDSPDPVHGVRLSERIHKMLFADVVEAEEGPVHA
jgi:NitT/TauT family transport system ATP-binding protein